MTIEFTAEAVTKALEESVAEKGADYVYIAPVIEWEMQTCLYAIDGQPSCLIGHALYRLGVPIQKLEEIGAITIETIAHTFGPMEDKLVIALNQAQLSQDGGETWGKALYRFKAELSA